MTMMFATGRLIDWFVCVGDFVEINFLVGVGMKIMIVDEWIL